MSCETGPARRWAGSRLYGGPMASVKQFQVTFDCAEPERVARFGARCWVRRTAATGRVSRRWDHFDRAAA